MSGFKKTFDVVMAPTAAGADFVQPACVAPFDGEVTSVKLIPTTVLTGVVTNSRTISVVNKGQSGSGNTVVATKAFVNAVNAPAADETDITLSATAANRDVVEGDVLYITSTHVGTGLADPGGLIRITIQRS
jgi:hypothetical protein